MKNKLRLALLASAVLTVVLAGDASPAFARHHHHSHHTARSHHHVRRHHSKGNERVRQAQVSLINLGYYQRNPDGILGPQTKIALRAFQRAQHMRVTGVLDTKTYNALLKAERKHAMEALPLPHVGVTSIAPPALYGKTDQQYADPFRDSPVVAGSKDSGQAVRTQGFESRYAKIDVNENINGAVRRYAVTINGTPILQVDNQPSVIGISETYHLGTEDAIIFTTYRDNDPVCAYKYFLLTLTEGSNQLRSLDNCTHGYQARVVEQSLFIAFPEVDSPRISAPATWRYEDGNLTRL